MKARPLRDPWARALVVLLAAALGGGVAASRKEPAPVASAPAAPALASGAEAERLPADEEELRADARCRALLAETKRAVGLPSPAVNEPELRAQLFGRAKAVPVLFVAAPRVADGSDEAARLRQELVRLPGHEVFGRVVGKVRQSPELARAVFLRDGYLYTEVPELASLYGSLTLSLLFRDSELRIERGAETLAARRLSDGDYEYGSGPERGKRAKLLLFDRVYAAQQVPGPPLHADLRALARGLGFDELGLERVTPQRLIVHAVYGAARVPTLLQLEQGRAALACEVLGGARSEVLAYRGQAERAERVQSQLLSVVKEQVEEGLPFDEPKTEDGQQDGHLRPEWRNAYLRGSSSFEFNGDRYSVFDSSGRPRPPQVCIDFVLDTFERASGTWWRRRELPRERVLGRLRFDRAAIANRRSVERFIEFARAERESFDVWEPEPEARVPLRQRQQFFAAVYRTRDHYRKGDVVAILGPRDDEQLHYHSFFIVDRDPLSGMPTEVAANAGRPRIRSWEGEMSNAPRRSIFARIRPRQLWLESFMPPLSTVSADSPPELPARLDAVSPVPEPTAG